MKAACYFDADNTEYKRILPILNHLVEYENLIIISRKAYGDFWSEQLAPWRKVCKKNNIIPCFSIIGNGKKNSTDMTLMLDAHSDLIENPNIEVFVIFSDDADFIPITIKLQYYGKEVWVVGHQKNISSNLLKLCNKFIDININSHSDVSTPISDNEYYSDDNNEPSKKRKLEEPIEIGELKNKINITLNEIFESECVSSMRLSIIKMYPEFEHGYLNNKLYGYSKFQIFMREFISDDFIIETKNSKNSDVWISKK